MRRWGRLIVIAAILATILAIISKILSWNGIWITILAVIMWTVLLLSYLITIARLRRELDIQIEKGVWIKARLTSTSEATYDKYSSMIREWVESVDKTLKGTEYEHSWKFDVGLTNPEDESQLVVLERLNAVDRNYMFRRLTRLKEIRDSL